MISIVLFLLSEYYDDFGVKFEDSTKSRLVNTLNTLTNYTIPYETKIISGGSGPETEISSSFYPCREKLVELKFSVGSKLETIEPYGLYKLTNIRELDMSVCTNLKILSGAALSHCYSLTKIKLPPNLQIIEEGSIESTKIRSIEFPSTLETISGWSYYGQTLAFNKQLTSISWGAEPKITTIGNCVFRECNISFLYIPKSLTWMASEVFLKCPITSITVDPNNEKFSTDGKFLFNKDKTAVKFVPGPTKGIINLDEKISTLSYGCFMGTSIETVNLTDNIKSIESDCFMYSTIEYITIPSSVILIGTRAMAYCKSIHTIIINASIKETPTSMCVGCIKLKSLSFPQGLEKIGKYTLSDCCELDNIFIPRSVKTIEAGAFSGVNTSATYVLEEGSKLKYSDGYFYNNNYTIIVAFTRGDENYVANIKSTVTEIGPYSFKGIKMKAVKFEGNLCSIIGEGAFSESSIENFTVISSIRKICSSAFSKCKSLKKLIFEEGVNTIEDRSFESTSISNPIYFPKSLKVISDYSFLNCVNMYSINFVSGSLLKNIGREAFSGTSITSVTIPPSVEEIGWSAFKCNNLKILNFEERIEKELSVPERSFSGCSGINEIRFSRGIIGIRNYAFEDCTSIEYLSIGEDIINISSQAFKGCIELKEIFIPDNSYLQNIESLAFEGCEKLMKFNISDSNPSFSTNEGVLFNKPQTSIVLYLPAHPRISFEVPDTVNKIQIFSFQNAINLERIELKESIQIIEYGAFMGCVRLSKINIPLHLINIAQDVFKGCELLKGCESIIYDKKQYDMLIKAGAPSAGLMPCPTAIFSLRGSISEFNGLLATAAIASSD